MEFPFYYVAGRHTLRVWATMSTDGPTLESVSVCRGDRERVLARTPPGLAERILDAVPWEYELAVPELRAAARGDI